MKIEDIEMDNDRLIHIIKLIQEKLKDEEMVHTGICKIFYNLRDNKLATHLECEFIRNLLELNRPTKKNKYKTFTQNEYWHNNNTELVSYWWDEINIAPQTRQIRIDYLTALISNIK